MTCDVHSAEAARLNVLAAAESPRTDSSATAKCVRLDSVSNMSKRIRRKPYRSVMSSPLLVVRRVALCSSNQICSNSAQECQMCQVHRQTTVHDSECCENCLVLALINQ